MLSECSLVSQVEAVKSKESQGWTIEVSPKENSASTKDYLLELAKGALFSATSSSNTAYIMGYAKAPFMSTPRGLVTILGDMQDESRACWDFYSNGRCTRECECRWEHPECLMPLNIVFKEDSAMLNTVVEEDS